MRRLQEDLFLQKTFTVEPKIYRLADYPKLEAAKNRAIEFCMSELQHATPERANILANSLKDIYSFERMCLYSKMTVPTQPPSHSVLLNTHNTTAVSSWFHHLSTQLYTIDNLEALLGFVLSYLRPYELILNSSNNNLNEIFKTLSNFAKSDGNSSAAAKFSDVVKRFEEIYSESKFLMTFCETWKGAAGDLLQSSVAEESFFEQTQFFKSGGNNSKEHASKIGGLALFRDLYDIMQSNSADAIVNLLRKLLSIHALLGK